MNPRDIRLARLRELLKEHDENRTALAARIGKSPPQISQWLSGYRTITEDTAREIEKAAGKPAGWMDQEKPSGISLSVVVAHDMSLRPVTLPPKIKWEDVMRAEDLPGEFVVAMPDDALAPSVGRGTDLIFSTAATPVPGLGVLVEDASGHRYIRRFVEGPAGTWQAHAANKAYAPLESEQHGLKVLAVMTGRMDGHV